MKNYLPTFIMKTKLFIITCLSVVTACSDYDSSQEVYYTNSTSTSDIRSLDEALKIAQSSISLLESDAVTRSLSGRKINLKDCKIVKAGLTRNAKNVNDTILYIFNFENNEGFAVVSALRNTEGLIAVTEKGNYSSDTPTGISGFDMYMDFAKEYIVNSKTTKTRALGDEQYKDSTIITYEIIVSPMVNVAWGQTYPEGEFCPNGIAGCTNTAIAQIMSHFEYPDSIQLTYPNADKNWETLNWTNMKYHETGHSLSNCVTPGTHSSIGRLLRQLGMMNNSTYYTDGSGTRTSTMTYAKSTMTNLGYITGAWTSYVLGAESQLDSAHVVLVRGQRDNNIGHVWVLDGYGKRVTIRQQYKWNNAGFWQPNGLPIISRWGLFHYNWGWYGICNGYFLIPGLDTSEAFLYDNREGTDVNYVVRNYNENVYRLSVYR